MDLALKNFNNGGERAKNVRGTMGKKAPFIWGHKMWPLGLKSSQPRQIGLGPSWLGRSHRWPAWAWPEPGLGWPNYRKTPNTKMNIF